MNILSLFDGMSGGRIALDRANIEVGTYYASEVDKYAIKVSEANYPDIVRLGDVTNWREWDIDWAEIDLLIGGSPCQGFSFAGKQLAFDDPRSKLFFVYVDILNHIRKHNPRVKFMLENVKMKKEYLEVISEQLGVQPVFINSALVSAQNRQRYYWANWEFGQPEDKGIVLADILEDGEVDRDKSYCIDANYHKGGNPEQYFNKSRRQLVFHPASIVGRRLNERGVMEDYNKNVPITQCLQVKHNNEKMGCLTTVQKDTVISPMKPGRYPISASCRGRNPRIVTEQLHGKSLTLTANYYKGLDADSRPGVAMPEAIGKEYGEAYPLYFRKLTPLECERLQTVPDGFSAHVSNTQRYKMLGNGFTVDVIAHILKQMPV